MHYKKMLVMTVYLLAMSLQVNIIKAEADDAPYVARKGKKNHAAITEKRLEKTNPKAAAELKEVTKNPVEKTKQPEKKEELEDDDVMGGLDLVKAYINAKNNYEIASKNNPMTLVFAGDEKKAARKLYEQAEAALEAPKLAYKNWLTMVEVTDQDYAQVKSYVQTLVTKTQKSYDQAKKESPAIISPFASSEDKKRLEAKRAVYEKVTIELATVQALLKDLNKKK